MVIRDLDGWDVKLVMLTKSDVDRPTEMMLAKKIWAERCGVAESSVNLMTIVWRMAEILDCLGLTTISSIIEDQHPQKYGGLVKSHQEEKSYDERWYDTLSGVLCLSLVSKFPKGFFDGAKHYTIDDYYMDNI